MFIFAKKILCTLTLCAAAGANATEKQEIHHFLRECGKGAFDFGTGFASGVTSAVAGRIIFGPLLIMSQSTIFATAASLPVAMQAGRGVFVTFDHAGEFIGITHYDDEPVSSPHQQNRFTIRSAGFLLGALTGSYYRNPALQRSLSALGDRLGQSDAEGNC